MELLDDDGNLFGVVNVIDALAVLLVIAVLLAGAVLLGFIGPEPNEETRYVTIDLGKQPEYVAEQINEGDVMAPATTDGNLTVTDVYVTPTSEDTVSVTIRAKLEGEIVESDQRVGTVFEYDDTVVRRGTSLTVVTPEYELEGTVVSMARENTSLETAEKAVTLRTSLPTETAQQLETGDTYEVAGHTVATIESVRINPTGDPASRRVIIEARLQAIERNGSLMFGPKPLKLGTSIPIGTDIHDFSGTLIVSGSLAETSETKTVTAVIKLKNIPPEQVDGLGVGMTERIDGSTNARVVDKRVEPAVVILTSEDGDIHKREHPSNKDVYLTVELEVRATDDGLYFHGKRLVHGDDVVLDFRTVTVRGTVVEIDE